jgi:hypothetical protein
MIGVSVFDAAQRTLLFWQFIVESPSRRAGDFGQAPTIHD